MKNLSVLSTNEKFIFDLSDNHIGWIFNFIFSWICWIFGGIKK